MNNNRNSNQKNNIENKLIEDLKNQLEIKDRELMHHEIRDATGGLNSVTYKNKLVWHCL